MIGRPISSKSVFDVFRFSQKDEVPISQFEQIAEFMFERLTKSGISQKDDSWFLQFERIAETQKEQLCS